MRPYATTTVHPAQSDSASLVGVSQRDHPGTRVALHQVRILWLANRLLCSVFKLPGVQAGLRNTMAHIHGSEKKYGYH
jgi:hypothetical protein